MSNEKSDIEKMYADYMENMKVLISDFPQYSVHSNYPGVWSVQDKTKKAVQTIYFGGESDSCIILPEKRLP